MRRPIVSCFLAAVLLAPLAGAQGGTPAVVLRTEKVTDSIHCIFGPQAGNIGALIGPDGIILIDDQYAPYTDRILGELKKLSDQPVKFLVNTHWHFDHTGGNENMGEAGAIIVAHRNVRERMSTTQFMEAFGRATPPSPARALPTVTFSEAVSFHWNGDDVSVFHVPAAHTDGDAIVHFEKNDVIHMGDVYFNGMYPFIDRSSGGSIDGVIAAQKKVAAMASETTRIIPGHGAVSGVAELKAATAMLVDVRDAIRKLVADGHSLEEIVAAKPTAAHDEKWATGFINGEGFVCMVHWLLTGTDEGIKRFAEMQRRGR